MPLEIPTIEEMLARNRAREAFRAGFTLYVGAFVLDHPDMYWNPRRGEWVSLTSDKWQITDKGLPQTGIDFPADSFFDELMSGWEAMAKADKDAAVWSPSKKRWLIATSGSAKGPDGGTGTGGSTQKEIEQWLTHLHEVYVKGLMTYPVYLRAVSDVLAGRPPTI